MGMPIDKTISELEILKKNTFSYMTANQAFTTAIDILRKYQKIKQIIADWESDDGAFKMSESDWLRKIGEVLEGENNSSD